MPNFSPEKTLSFCVFEQFRLRYLRREKQKLSEVVKNLATVKGQKFQEKPTIRSISNFGRMVAIKQNQTVKEEKCAGKKLRET